MKKKRYGWLYRLLGNKDVTEPTVKLPLAGVLAIFLSFTLTARADTKSILQDDLKRLLKQAQLTDNQIQFDISNQKDFGNEVNFKCNANGLLLMNVVAKPEETVSTFYYGLHKLGFYFPHPRVQISPDKKAILAKCGTKAVWEPSIVYRGFHLHTQHPNEWVAGFFQGDKEIVHDTIFWLARNFQNVLQVQLLQNAPEVYSAYFLDGFQLAHELQIRTGVVVSFSSQQQKSYHLLALWQALTGFNAIKTLNSQVDRLLKLFNVDFITVELGTSEFTSMSFHNTLSWINELAIRLRTLKKFLLVRAHASINQYGDKYGNYNFIVQHAHASAGLLAHTVMFYGLRDAEAPAYGRKNFSDLYALMQRESKTRVTWYFPETSYFIGMDIDVPLFLTDYLKARADDYKIVSEEAFTGHINFTSGQELGYWLFDWNVALQANKEYLGDETIGLKLLGEDLTVWRKIISYQTEYIKRGQLLEVISAENFFDAMPFNAPIHSRILINDLAKNESYLRDQIKRLESAIANKPSVDGVKNAELKAMLNVTFYRLEHALHLREAILNRQDAANKKNDLGRAQKNRLMALEVMHSVVRDFNRYPKAKIFEKSEKNPTSYKYGYGWPALSLHFWEREERLVDKPTTNPFFMNIYQPQDILF